MNTTKRKLPIGIQTFRSIRENNTWYYVDKTPFIYQLIDQGKYYFLSRPRRFGKSLLVDTMKELFEGNRALFAGLFIEDQWDWSVRYPIIHISFGQGVVKNRAELDQRIAHLLRHNQKRLELTCPQSPDLAGWFADLIEEAHERHGQPVVVLVDEYDKPILDNIIEPETARQMREGLKNLYSVVKESDAHIRFVFLTGVSKFSQVSLFSGLNNLEDITLRADCSAICGYTDQDLDTVFAPELAGLDRAAIRSWYNGYNWLGESVYNPFDILNLFRKRILDVYWFQTGTPEFLVKLLSQRDFFTPDLARLEANTPLLSAFDVDHITTEALLFQTGYLTIHESESSLTSGQSYILGYPNKEVEISLNDALLPAYGLEARHALKNRKHLLTALHNNDFDAMRTHLEALFDSLTHDAYRKTPIAQYEGYYASVFYSHWAAMGVDIRLEDACNQGKIDMTLQHGGQIYLFEFKMVETEATGGAMRQLKTKNYAAKYRASGKLIYLIGIEFSKRQRNIVGFEVEVTLE